MPPANLKPNQLVCGLAVRFSQQATPTLLSTALQHSWSTCCGVLPSPSLLPLVLPAPEPDFCLPLLLRDLRSSATDLWVPLLVPEPGDMGSTRLLVVGGAAVALPSALTLNVSRCCCRCSKSSLQATWTMSKAASLKAASHSVQCWACWACCPANCSRLYTWSRSTRTRGQKNSCRNMIARRCSTYSARHLITMTL